MIAALAWIFISPTPGLDTTRLRALVAGVFCIASSCWFFLILRNSSTQKCEMSDSGNTIKPFTYVLAIIYVSICPLLVGKHLMPYLPWSLADITRWGYYSQIPVTLASCFGGIIFLTYFLRRYSVGWWIAPMESKIIDLTSLFLLGAHLIFFTIGDEYLLDLLPLTILVVGKRLTTRIFQFPYGFVGGSLLIGLFWANSTRANLSSTEARWNAAEAVVRDRKADVRDVFTDWTWVSYYRFGDYVSDIGGRVFPDFSDFFSRWIPEQQQRALYVYVSDEQSLYFQTPDLPVNWRDNIVFEGTYRDFRFKKRSVYMLKKPSELH
jgi:hypothetical protein